MAIHFMISTDFEFVIRMSAITYAIGIEIIPSRDLDAFE